MTKPRKRTIRAVLLKLGHFGEGSSEDSVFIIDVPKELQRIRLAVESQLPEMYRKELETWARELE